MSERHDPETHLIPLVLRAAASARPVSVFGTDYPTRDGSCIRDYIHVMDLCDAHLRALERLGTGSFDCFNLGNGQGASVLEVIEAARRVLGWQPAHPGIETIVRDAWAFEQRRSQ